MSAPTMDTWEAFADRLVAASQSETDALFEMGDALAEACAPAHLARWGMTQTAVLAEAGIVLGASRRTMQYRLKVARTFDQDARSPRLTWYTHLIAAQTATPDRPDLPHAWLAAAADNEWTAGQLKAAIDAAGETRAEVERVVVMRSRLVRIEPDARGWVVVFDGAPAVDADTDYFMTVAFEREKAAQEVAQEAVA